MQTETLIRIARLLILHVGTINNLGILKGKMGLILFFFHLSRRTDHCLYQEFAEKLLDEVYEDMRNTNNKQIVYQECSEIAWGLLYLIRHHFVEGDEEDVVAMFGTLIFQNVAVCPDTKIHATVHYLAGCRSADTAFAIPPHFVEDLFTRMKCKPEQWEHELRLLDKLQKQESVTDYVDSFLQKALKSVQYVQDEIFSDRPIGIEANGLAGIGLKMIFTNSEKA